jgi:hypothetical protein
VNSDLYLVAVGLIGARELTDEVLNEVMGILARIDPSAEPEALLAVRKRLEANIGVSMLAGHGLHGGDQEPWLDEVKASIKWTYWTAYAHQLRASGFGNDIVRVLDEDTDNILNECGNPADKTAWLIKGLVMGDVQSGKTASYTGLANKAADAGYKVIVLLTGMIEELRAQSQGRLDEGFVGRDSRDLLGGNRSKQPIGSGRFKPPVPNVLTSIESDFLNANSRALGGIPLANINEPVLLVMKKNKAPLENLLSYLDSQLRAGATTLDLPLLLIDDEADNASVNAKKDEDPATINRLIRGLLARFSQASYVAYTATPFANVFINPDLDDLFPSNFVYSLNTPTNYIGATSVFSGSHQHQLVDIKDAQGIFPYKHKKELVVQQLPTSLLDAVAAFLISCTIRDIREEPLRHRSMLVNVTRFTDVQRVVAKLLKDYLYALMEEIKQYLADDDAWAKHQLLLRLREVWAREYAEAGCSWESVRKHLYESTASVKVLTINQETEAEERLNYAAYKNSDKGRRAIVVGGLTLSRGLTLEGLCVSYFLRNSKAYDTLLQMGRWFGYRPGYDDLCRIWMDPVVQDWFEHIADVVAELRTDIRRMHANRWPPRKFGMRVKAHPDTLIVTAMNKMRNSKEVEHSVSFSGYGAETPFAPASASENLENVREVAEFVTQLGKPEAIGTRYYWRERAAKVVASFLRKLKIPLENMAFVPDLSGDRPILAFIGNSGLKELAFWDICMPQGEGAPVPAIKVIHGGGSHAVNPRKRQFEKVAEGSEYLKLNKQRVGEISDEMVDLKQEEIDSVAEEWERERASDPEKGKTVPGYMYRRIRKRPLLTISVIQPVDPTPDSKRADRMMKVNEIAPSTVIAIALSFPSFEKNGEMVTVSYQLNKVALRNIGLIGDEDEEDED